MEKVTCLDESVLNFLKILEKNNDREWFNKNKSKYLAAHEQVKKLAERINEGLEKQDNIEKMKLYRIYRDVRFSKNKDPYKNNFSGGYSRATKALRGSYYIHFQPGNKSMIGGGFWGPNAEDLKRIRVEIAADDAPLRRILNSTSFKNHFGVLGGQQLKTSPKGFENDHPAVDLLRFKSFILTKHFSDQEVMTPGFVKKVLVHFKAMRPFLDYMSEVLTTDANGESLID
jgi:uncharacterized protein (TIGR02453 family)